MEINFIEFIVELQNGSKVAAKFGDCEKFWSSKDPIQILFSRNKLLLHFLLIMFLFCLLKSNRKRNVGRVWNVATRCER